MIIPAIYDHIYNDFSSRRILVKDNNLYGFYDTQGNQITQVVYEQAWNFEGPVARIRDNRLCGLINLQGNEILPPTYDEIKAFKDGFALVRKDNKYGIIDQQGALVKDTTFNEPIKMVIQHSGQKHQK